MKTLKSIILISLVGTLLSACSTQWRETDPGIDSHSLFEIIDSALPDTSVLSGRQASQDFLKIAKFDVYSTIFYAEGPGSMGSVASTLAFIEDFSILGKSGKTQEDVVSVVVMLAEGMIDGGGPLRYALLFDIVFRGGERLTTTFSSSTDRVVDGKEFTVAMSGSTGEIVLRSLDISGDELKNVIQIEIYESVNGELWPIGKVSTMAAFAP